MPKFFHFVKYQLSVLIKPSILDDLSNEYPNFAQKIQLNTYRIIILITFQFPRNIVIDTVLHSGTSVQLSNIKN